MLPFNQRGKDHEYVVTRVDDGNKVLNGEPVFLLVDGFDQALCLAETYLYEDHATIDKGHPPLRQLTVIPYRQICSMTEVSMILY